MGKNDGDAYPDPRKERSGKCKMRALVCIGLFLMCFCGFIATVSAPGDALPDPRSVPKIVLNGHVNGEPAGNLAMRTQPVFIIE